jgi:sugar phosphate isomerase/epimerase
MLASLRENGIAGIELSSGLAATSEELDLVARSVADGLQVLVHNYFPARVDAPIVLNLADPDKEARRRSVAFARDAMTLAARYDAPFYSVHAGFAHSLAPRHLGAPERYRELPSLDDADRLRALAHMRESVDHLAEHGDRIGVGLLIENNVVDRRVLDRPGWHGLLLADAEEIGRFLEPFAGRGVGLLLDTAHAAVTCRTLGCSLAVMLDAVRPFVEAVHISHTDGIEDRNHPVRGSTPGLSFLATRDVPVVVEVYGLDPSAFRGQSRLIAKARGGSPPRAAHA